MPKVGELWATLGLDKRSYTQGLSDSQRQLSGFERVSDRAWGAIGRVAKRALQGISIALGKAVFDAAAFQSQMAEVSTMLDEMGMEQLPAMEQGILDMSEAFGESTQTLTRGLYDILSASVPAADAMDVLGVAAMTAKGGLTDTGTAADAITTLLNAFGKSADQANYFADLMFATVRLGKTTMNELAPAIGGVATLAAEAGVTMEELSAWLAELTKRGISTDQAVTFMRAALVQMLKPAEDAAATAKELGIQIDLAGIKTMGLAGVMEQFKDLPPDVMAKLFPNVRALQGVTLAADGFGDSLDKINDMMKVGSPMMEAFEKNTSTFRYAWDQFTKSLKVTVITIGNKLIPKVREVIDAIREWLIENRDRLAKFFGDFVEGLRNAVEWIINMKDVLIPLGAAMAGILIAEKAAVAIAALTTALKMGMGPVGWIAAGVGILVAGFVALRRAVHRSRDAQELIDEAFAGNLDSVEEYNDALAALEYQQEGNEKQYARIADQLAIDQKATEFLSGAIDILEKSQEGYLDSLLKSRLAQAGQIDLYDKYNDGLITAEHLLMSLREKQNWLTTSGFTMNEMVDQHNEYMEIKEGILANIIELEEAEAEARAKGNREMMEAIALQKEMYQQSLDAITISDARASAAAKSAKVSKDVTTEVWDWEKKFEDDRVKIASVHKERTIAQQELWLEYLEEQKEKEEEALEEEEERIDVKTEMYEMHLETKKSLREEDADDEKRTNDDLTDDLKRNLRIRELDFAAFHAANVYSTEIATGDMKDSFEDLGESILQVIQNEAVDAFRDLGAAIVDGGIAMEDLRSAIGNIGLAILDAAPALLLQAGLAILPTNFIVGLILIAASGLVAIGAGIIDEILGAAEPGGDRQAVLDRNQELDRIMKERLGSLAPGGEESVDSGVWENTYPEPSTATPSVNINPTPVTIVLDDRVMGEAVIKFVEDGAATGDLAIDPRAVRSDK